MSSATRLRSQIDSKYKWNAESVFADHEAWARELSGVLEDADDLALTRGHVADNPSSLTRTLRTRDSLVQRASVVEVYAGLSYAVDATDQRASASRSQAQDMSARVQAAGAHISPEILAVGVDRIREWMQESAELTRYRHYFHDLFRRQAHIRSAEVEEVLELANDPMEAGANSSSALLNADLTFPSAYARSGKSVRVTQANIHTSLLHSPDRRLRRTAWHSYMDRHREFRNTLANNLASSIKANVLRARVRGFDSTLAAALFELNVPERVYHNLIDIFRRNLPTWHRYFSLRRRALDVAKLSYFDLWAPMGRRIPRIPYEEAVTMICDGLRPLGEEYIRVVRRGCRADRWVDVYPNRGKSNGAFSWGAPGTHPFIKMNYSDEMVSVSTLAHELGHSMHSYWTWKSQPLVYSDYSLFVAEVASNFHQVLVRAHLIASKVSNDFEIAVLEEAMGNFLRYFFLMPTLARFELETHRRAERGQALTADSMCAIMRDLFSEAFGPEVELDRDRVGMIWSTFGHLFSDYYVYAYGTGIAGAHALAGRVQRGEPGAVPDYLGFLEAGASDYSLEVLRRAGVDLASPDPIEETFATMESYVERLERLLIPSGRGARTR